MPIASILTLFLFATTLFLSATLLFLVQPMVGKMLLPMLGGTPAVWNTCMVFFQALLLAGYAYAHATTAWLGERRQAVLHLGILLLPFLTLGLTVDAGLLDYGEGSPIPGLLLVLLLSVGLPFGVVSTSAPLLQKWFAGTGHPAARDPYFLYGASNLGSMLALVGYPAVIEPRLTLAQQRFLWQIGYSLLVLLTAVCAVCLWRSRGQTAGAREAEPASATDLPLSSHPTPLTFARRLRWVALAFVPSSLMLGVTTYMTTDIAAIPLLWVLPLGLYLLSFILVFSRLPDFVHRCSVALLPFVVLLLVFLMLSEYRLPIWWRIVAHLAVLFLVAMVCHGELARDRPPTRYLTGYYLWISVGGVLGGLFNALLAPILFNGIVEYPLALVLACILMPASERGSRQKASLLGATGLMGFYLGGGIALLIPALGRTDLTFAGLAGGAGPWLLAALLATVAVVAWHASRNSGDRGSRWLDLGLPAALGILAIGLNLGLRIATVHSGLDRVFGSLHQMFAGRVPARISFFLDPASNGVLILFVCVVPVVLCALFMDRPLRFGLGIGALLLGNAFCNLLDDDVLLRRRSFFGVLQVANEGSFRRLEHGTTLHGQQRLRWSRTALAAGAASSVATTDPLSGIALLALEQDVWLNPGREPLTYFHRTGPIGQVFTAYRDQLAHRHVGLIGLGSGTLASYGQPGQRMTYFEIDPLVKRIAWGSDYFTFVQNALDRGVALDLVLGDARLKLEERAHQPASDKFALLVVDAFSSDAIPVHLITRQALAIDLENLAADGILVFHISNRYLDLEPVLGNLAADLGLTGFIQNDYDSSLPGKASSSWVVLAKEPKNLDRLIHEGRWEEYRTERGWDATQPALEAVTLFPDSSGPVHAQSAMMLTLCEHVQAPWRRLKLRPEVGVWTDDYSNLLSVFDWQR